MKQSSRLWRRLLVMAVCTVILAVFGTSITWAQDAEPAFDAAAAIGQVQVNLDASWLLLTAFLVFFMQAGFALLEAGMIRQGGVVNSLMENFMDACIGGLCFWAVGYAIAFGASSGGWFGSTNFFLSDAITLADGSASFGDGVSIYVMFFFQFAFAATAGTIATGAMAERTNFIGKIIYTAIVAAIIYPVVVHWIWGGGWIFQRGFFDFAGSTVVHMTGGIIALIGAMMLGPRVGRVFGNMPRPHNLALATLGALILWFGWYGFNPGSALAISNNGLVGLVAVNTTLGACAGAVATMFFMYFRTGKWDLPASLNGSLAGLVAITAGCAFVMPWASVVIGIIAGVLVILSIDVIEKLKIDDAVGAFSVHGVCGAMGTLAIGFLGQPELGAAGLFTGGDATVLINQIIGILAVSAWASVTTVIMFAALKALGVLRIPAKSDAMGIDMYEHGTTVWPDVLSPESMVEAGKATKKAPAVGD